MLTPPTESELTRLDRYVAGDCAPAEADAVRRWLRTRPDLAQMVEGMRDAGRVPGVTEPHWDARPIWARIAPALQATSVGRKRTARHTWHIPALLAVAVVLVALGGSVWSWHAGHDAVGPRVSAWLTYTTAPGQRGRLTLRDGTRVTLGAATTLRVAPDYGRRTREVQLEGEGFFDVIHDAAHPFSVRAGAALARDVGTRFDVRAYATDTATRVLVTDGRVAIDRTELSAGEMVLVSHRGRVSSPRDVTVDDYLGWIDGRLAFVSVPAADVVAEIGRWYDLDIQLADSALTERRLTLTLTLEDGPTHVLDGLAALLHARYERDGRRVTLFTLGSSQ